MVLHAGLLIQSTAALADTLFANALIFITTCNSKGAIGFVVNKPFGRALNELEEFRHSAPFPLFDGGPVDKEHLFFLHNRPDVIADGVPAAQGIYTGGNFNQALTGLNNKTLTQRHLKLFIGYCGWDAGELEAEIKEGSWEILTAGPAIVFK